MRQVSISCLCEGMILANEVKQGDNVIVQKGYQLQAGDGMISILSSLKIDEVSIMTIDDASYSDDWSQIIEQLYDALVQFNLCEICYGTLKIVELIEDNNCFNCPLDLFRDENNYEFRHCIFTTITAVRLAVACKYTRQEIRTVALTSILQNQGALRTFDKSLDLNIKLCNEIELFLKENNLDVPKLIKLISVARVFDFNINPKSERKRHTVVETIYFLQSFEIENEILSLLSKFYE